MQRGQDIQMQAHVETRAQAKAQQEKTDKLIAMQEQHLGKLGAEMQRMTVDNRGTGQALNEARIEFNKQIAQVTQGSQSTVVHNYNMADNRITAIDATTTKYDVDARSVSFQNLTMNDMKVKFDVDARTQVSNKTVNIHGGVYQQGGSGGSGTQKTLKNILKPPRGPPPGGGQRLAIGAGQRAIEGVPLPVAVSQGPLTVKSLWSDAPISTGPAIPIPPGPGQGQIVPPFEPPVRLGPDGGGADRVPRSGPQHFHIGDDDSDVDTDPNKLAEKLKSLQKDAPKKPKPVMGKTQKTFVKANKARSKPKAPQPKAEKPLAVDPPATKDGKPVDRPTSAAPKTALKPKTPKYQAPAAPRKPAVKRRAETALEDQRKRPRPITFQ